MKPFAKKRFGQNFLIDLNILKKIVKTISPQQGEIIVEIGPGKGALTELLVNSKATIHAIEIDEDLIPELKEKFIDHPNFHLHNHDALKFDYQNIIESGKKIRFVGNIPYNISSQLLFMIFEIANLVTDIHFMIQKEIAQRIAAKSGSKNYGILSVISSFYGNPKMEFTVSPNVFRPIPKVNSALFSIFINPKKIPDIETTTFKNVVKTAFNKRRKTLKNSLKDILPKNPANCPIDLSRRPETLELKEFLFLTQYVLSQQNNRDN